MSNEKPSWDSVDELSLTTSQITTNPSIEAFLSPQPLNDSIIIPSTTSQLPPDDVVSTTIDSSSINHVKTPSLDLDDFVEISPHDDFEDTYQIIDLPCSDDTDGSDDDDDDNDPDDNCYGINAYLDDLRTESPCIYNIIREGKNRIVVDTTYSHTLDCPVSAARTPMLNEKVFDYYAKKMKREERQKRRQKRQIQKQIKTALQQQEQQQQQQQQQERQQSKSTSHPTLATHQEEPDDLDDENEALHTPKTLSPTSSIMSNPRGSANVPNLNLNSNSESDMSDAFVEGELVSIGARLASFSQCNDNVDDNVVKNDNDNVQTAIKQDDLSNSNPNKDIDVEKNDLEVEKKDLDDENEGKDTNNDDDGIAIVEPIIIPTNLNPALSSDDSGQTPTSILTTPLSTTTSPLSDVVSPGELLLRELQQQQNEISSLCTCGGGDDLFSARQCSVELRARFISQALAPPQPQSPPVTSPTPDTQQKQLTSSKHKITPPSPVDLPSSLATFPNSNAQPHLLKVYTLSWNLFGSIPSTFNHVIPPSVFDIYLISLQECGSVSQSLMGSTHANVLALLLDAVTGGDPDSGDYTCIASSYLQTILTFVIIRTPLMRHVHGVTKEVVATGYADMFGNKGGVAVRFFLGATSICCIGSHFNSGQGALEKRNQDYHKISGKLTLGLNDCTISTLQQSVFPYQSYRNTFRTTSLSAHGFSATPQPYKQFYPNYSDVGSRSDLTFWLGDLNYRIHGTKHSVEDMLAFHRHFALLHLDQLNAERESQSIFYGFKEGIIAFPPTYKYDPGQQCYDTSQKQRIPSWTDRILYRDNCTWCCHQRGVCDCASRPCLYEAIVGGSNSNTNNNQTVASTTKSPVPAATTTPSENNKTETSTSTTIATDTTKTIDPTSPLPQTISTNSTSTPTTDSKTESTTTTQQQITTKSGPGKAIMEFQSTQGGEEKFQTAVSLLADDKIEPSSSISRESVSTNEAPLRPSRPKGFSLGGRPSVSLSTAAPLSISSPIVPDTPPPPLPQRKRPQLAHNCQRALLEKYGCIQTAIESDHRPVFAHFIIACKL